MIEHLRDSDYVNERSDESFSRTIIDLIILERLRIVKDKDGLWSVRNKDYRESNGNYESCFHMR